MPMNICHIPIRKNKRQKRFHRRKIRMEETNKQGNPLGFEPIGKLLRTFALPSVVSMLVNAVYNIVDQIFIGQGVGYKGNAATTIVFPIVTIMVALGALIGNGGSAYAALRLGEKKEEEAQHTLGNVFVLLLVAGIGITVLGFLFLNPLLNIFGATDATREYAIDYAEIILLGAPFNLLGIGLSNMVRTDGSPAFSMYGILIGAVLNTILDPIYIFVFHWGVKGAAVATITSQIISAVLLVGYFIKKGKMRLSFKSMKLSSKICRGFLALGISSFILQVANAVTQIVMNNSLVYYGDLSPVTGDVALSAMGIVLKINMILISICVGIGIGSQPILGFNKGAGQLKRVKETYLMAVKAASIVAIVGWLACIGIPHVILSIFGTQDGNFTEFAIKCMRVFLSGVFVIGLQITSTNYFQGTGQPAKAALLSSLRQIILLIPMVLILPLFFGLDGILYAGPVSDIASAFVALILITIEMKHLDKAQKNSQ